MRQIFIPATVIFLYGCSTAPDFRLPENSSEICRQYDSRIIQLINSSKVLTLNNARQTALQNNPDYRTAFQAVNAARYRYYEALGAYLPRLDAEFGISQELSRNSRLINPPDGIGGRVNSFGTSATLQASWLIFDGMAREFSVLMAKSDYASKTALDQNARRLLERAVSYAYFDTELAAELERIALADMEFQESSLRQAESRYRYGLVPLGDVLNFKIRRAMAQSQFYEARYRRESACFSLTSLMGYPAGAISDEVKLDRLEFDDTELLPDVDLSIGIAIQNRPDLRSSRILLRISAYRKYRGYSSFLPRIEAFADFGIAGHHTGFSRYKVNRSRYAQTSFEYGLAAEWNIFEGFRAWNELKALTADESMAALKLESEILECISSVQTACANLRNCREQIKLFREMREWVKQQRKLIYSEYQGGLVTITRVNEAQRDLVQAESDLASAMADYGKAKAQYQAAVSGN